jgi:hypothetical protein
MGDHEFTAAIRRILHEHIGSHADEVFTGSYLLQYLNIKTRSAHRGSKSRSSFSNLYALYVLIEDYVEQGFHTRNDYSSYQGTAYTKLFKRQRELPFGAKLQNHSLNNRTNAEFEKFFSTIAIIPIVRDVHTNRYWINEWLLLVNTSEGNVNIAQVALAIIDEYIRTKQDAFERFIRQCEQLGTQQDIGTSSATVEFITSLLAPNVDARLFEIVSYGILKHIYHEITVFWGYERRLDALYEERLALYKTGRTNANDGGIDFVMRPLGRLFQVTETLDFKKYFLDIDKIQKYPITFVVKSVDTHEVLLKVIRTNAEYIYGVTSVVERYMACIEELITIQDLQKHLQTIVKRGNINAVLSEIIIQSKMEFNYGDTK